MKKLALIYCRVSTQKQSDEGTSLGSQAESCLEYAKSHGLTVAKTTKEVFSGAEMFDRPKLAIDREEIRAGKYSAIIIHSIDRLSRNIAHLAIIEEECRRAGCELHFVTENLDSSAEGKLLHSVKAYVAEVERLKIRERSVRGKRAKLLMGKPVLTGSPLYGYAHNSDSTGYVIDESEAIIVRRIFDSILSGIGTHTLAKILNAEGIPSPFSGIRPGSLWTQATLFRLVKNPSYKGLEIRNRYKRIEGSAYINRPSDEHIKLPDGVRPVIIDESTWEQAQGRLKSNRGDAARNQKRFYLLRGMITCGNCQRRMNAVYTKHGRNEYHYYRCASIDVPYKHDCPGNHIKVSDLDAWVWDRAKEALKNPTQIKEQLKRLIESQSDSGLANDLTSTKQLYAKKEAQLKKLVAKFRNLDDVTLERIVEGEIEIASLELHQLAKEVERLESRQKSSLRLVGSFDRIFDYIGQVGGKLDSAEPAERRAVLEILNAEVIYKKDSPCLNFRFNEGVVALQTPFVTQRNYYVVSVA